METAFWLRPDWSGGSNLRDPGTKPFWCLEPLPIIGHAKVEAARSPNECTRYYPGHPCRVTHDCFYRADDGAWVAVQAGIIDLGAVLKDVTFQTNAPLNDFSLCH